MTQPFSTPMQVTADSQGFDQQFAGHSRRANADVSDAILHHLAGDSLQQQIDPAAIAA